jgi:hypothetical protein
VELKAGIVGKDARLVSRLASFHIHLTLHVGPMLHNPVDEIGVRSLAREQKCFDSVSYLHVVCLSLL